MEYATKLIKGQTVKVSDEKKPRKIIIFQMKKSSAQI